MAGCSGARRASADCSRSDLSWTDRSSDARAMSNSFIGSGELVVLASTTTCSSAGLPADKRGRVPFAAALSRPHLETARGGFSPDCSWARTKTSERSRSSPPGLAAGSSSSILARFLPLNRRLKPSTITDRSSALNLRCFAATATHKRTRRGRAHASRVTHGSSLPPKRYPALLSFVET